MSRRRIEWAGKGSDHISSAALLIPSVHQFSDADLLAATCKALVQARALEARPLNKTGSSCLASGREPREELLRRD
jgi:hypothetical protein